MKKIFTIVAAMMLCMPQANALLVSVDGYGELDENGLSITIEEGKADPLSGKYEMKLEGNVLTTSGTLNVTITRSEAGLSDEFCCGNNCTPGNKETTESKTFSFEGAQSWFVHYYPTAGSDVTITYTFTDGSESQTLTVHYIRESQGIENISADQAETTYTIDGTKVGNARVSELPAGLYIHGKNKILKTN